MATTRTRRSPLKDAIVTTLLGADGGTLNPLRLRRLVDSALGKAVPDGTWFGALKRLTIEGLIVDPSVDATHAQVDQLIGRMQDPGWNTSATERSDIALTKAGQVYGLVLDLEACAAPAKRKAAGRDVERVLALESA